MVTTKIGKGDIFGQNLPVQQDQNAFGRCSEYNEIQAGCLLQNEIKTISSFLQLSCTFPEHSPPGLPSALLHHQGDLSLTQPSGRAFVWKPLFFLVLFYVLSYNLLCPSQDAFPSASLLHSTHFCCQNSVQVLFILDVHNSYPTMQWPLLSDVLLSLVPSGLSCLFPLWHVPIKLQAL